ncbi:MAG TPA: TolC family protein [Saprospiraceae bacterium]|nr:TolC family protein [Saprospiraceae bacterium]
MKYLAFILFVHLSFASVAQEVWPLRKCIETAQQNSIQMQQSGVAIEREKINVTTSKASRLPDLNGGTSFYQSFGRRIDPTTNSFNNQTFSNQSYNLSSSVNLFSFNKISHSIHLNENNLAAAQSDRDQLANDIALQVAQVYLNVILSQENLIIAKQSLEQTNSQLSLTDKLINAGSKNRNSRLEIVAQQARDETDIIIAENQISSNLLDLKLLMQIDVSTDISVEVPMTAFDGENPEAIDFEQLYNQAIERQPKFKAYKNKLTSARLNEKISATSALPSLYAQGQLGSNYSSLNKKLGDITFVDVIQPGVKIDNQPVNFTVLSPQASYVNNPYFSQLNQNLGYGIGVGLNVPIYNNNRNKASVQQAKLNTEMVELDQLQAQQSLRKDVLQALNSALSAKRTFEAAQKMGDAMQGAYTDTQKRFEIGTTNTFELIASKNNLSNAERNMAISKYQYLFAMKVLDYYAGKQIDL